MGVGICVESTIEHLRYSYVLYSLISIFANDSRIILVRIYFFKFFLNYIYIYIFKSVKLLARVNLVKRKN